MWIWMQETEIHAKIKKKQVQIMKISNITEEKG